MIVRLLTDLGERLKGQSRHSRQDQVARSIALWQTGSDKLIEQEIICGIIDQRYGTDLALSHNNVSLKDLIDQYNAFAIFMRELKPCLEMARNGATYLHMSVNLEKRFRDMPFYEGEYLRFVTQAVYESGVSCFEHLGLSRLQLLNYPKTIRGLYQVYFPDYEQK